MIFLKLMVPSSVPSKKVNITGKTLLVMLPASSTVSLLLHYLNPTVTFLPLPYPTVISSIPITVAVLVVDTAAAADQQQRQQQQSSSRGEKEEEEEGAQVRSFALDSLRYHRLIRYFGYVKMLEGAQLG